MLKNMIIGTWSLITYATTLKESKVVFQPYGENPVGFLIYTSNDVSVHIMRAKRSHKVNPLEEKIESAENYGGYVGNYDIQNDAIIHYPKVSSFINFLLIPQIRKFKPQDDLLIFEYVFFNKEYDQKAHSELIWQRVT